MVEGRGSGHENNLRPIGECGVYLPARYDRTWGSGEGVPLRPPLAIDGMINLDFDRAGRLIGIEKTMFTPLSEIAIKG